jgi:hypothetical protein
MKEMRSMGRSVGFTGTSAGAVSEQVRRIDDRLANLKKIGFDEFHHGLCIGADEQAAAIAKRLGYRVVAHPGLASDAGNLDRRSTFDGNDEICAAKPFAERDREIVDTTECLLAVPSTREQDASSGTWATVRYARDRGKPVELILPVRADGKRAS